MGGCYVLAVLVGVLSLLTTGQCDVSCKGADGRAGEAGALGRDGWRGAKGEKGEPAVMADGPVDASALLRLKGESGSRGAPGAMGPKGYPGDLGAPGRPGKAGHPGPPGKSTGTGQHSPQKARSAFTAIRTETRYPPHKTVTYQYTSINKGDDFNINTAEFTCRIPGVYYFNFQSVAKVSMCLRIASDALNEKLGFCDYNTNSRNQQDQVLTGSVVLQMTTGQKVWLESFKDRQVPADERDTRDKQITFSGFLLFSNSE